MNNWDTKIRNWLDLKINGTKLHRKCAHCGSELKARAMNDQHIERVAKMWSIKHERCGKSTKVREKTDE